MNKESNECKELEIHRFIGDMAHKIEEIDCLLKDLEDRLDPVLRSDAEAIDVDNAINLDYPNVNTPLGKELLSFNIHLKKIEKRLSDNLERLEI